MSALAAVLCAGLSAEAAVLRINFAGSGGVATVTPSSPSVDVEVWVDVLGVDPLGDGPERISVVKFPLESLTGDPLVQTGVTWAPSGQNGSSSHPIPGGDIPIGTADWGVIWPSGGELTGPGTYLIGTMTLKAVDFTPATHELAIEHFSLLFLDEEGADYVLHYAYGTTYAGYLTYGDWGGSYQFKSPPFVERNPLELNVLPEPAALFVLAIGGIAVARRRR